MRQAMVSSFLVNSPRSQSGPKVASSVAGYSQILHDFRAKTGRRQNGVWAVEIPTSAFSTIIVETVTDILLVPFTKKKISPAQPTQR